MRIVADRRMPVFGIGAGMQLLNITMGGNLLLHIPEDRPAALPHLDPLDPAHRHTLELTPGSLMERVYGDGELRVNSAHHQAVRQVGDGFRIGATAPDGVIEAIESTDPNWFCIGVQWHPESDTATALDAQLFECFIQACLRQAQPLQLAA